MVFLSPLARYGLSNVEFMNIGRKYQAMSEGFEAMGEGLFKGAESRQARKDCLLPKGSGSPVLVFQNGF